DPGHRRSAVAALDESREDVGARNGAGRQRRGRVPIVWPALGADALNPVPLLDGDDLEVGTEDADGLEVGHVARVAPLAPGHEAGVQLVGDDVVDAGPGKRPLGAPAALL